jgi:hypothetical protein
MVGAPSPLAAVRIRRLQARMHQMTMKPGQALRINILLIQLYRTATKDFGHYFRQMIEKEAN